MYNGSNCDRKSQLSEILTEPSNPRVSQNGTSVLSRVLLFLSEN